MRFPDEVRGTMKPTTYTIKPGTSAERIAYYERLDGKCTSPLWEVRQYQPTPKSACGPALWRYAELRELLVEAGKLITPKEGVRRALLLENPGIRGRGFSQVCQSLLAAVQMILPGEKAPSHRHTNGAFRLVLEGEGALTAVEGEPVVMHPGDFILTPSWSFHEHANPTGNAVFWMDGLDLPIVELFDSHFRQFYPGGTQPNVRSDGDSLARFGSNMMPVDYTPVGLSSPLLVYPYSQSRAALEQLYRNGPVHPCHGIKLQYVNPATGGYALPTIAAFLQFLPRGFRGEPYRATDSTVFCAKEGKGRTHIGEMTFEWGLHDIFVAPSWYSISHEADEDAVLFSFSDRAAQKALGLWREEAPTVL
jgi:gentisate 1,2-dioxygenase